MSKLTSRQMEFLQHVKTNGCLHFPIYEPFTFKYPYKGNELKTFLSLKRKGYIFTSSGTDGFGYRCSIFLTEDGRKALKEAGI